MNRFIFFILTVCFTTSGMIHLSAFESQDILNALSERNDRSISENTDNEFVINPERLLFLNDEVYLEDDMGVLHQLTRFSYESKQYRVQKVKEYRCDRCGACYYGSHPSVCRCGGSSFSEITNCSKDLDNDFPGNAY